MVVMWGLVLVAGFFFFNFQTFRVYFFIASDSFSQAQTLFRSLLAAVFEHSPISAAVFVSATESLCPCREQEVTCCWSRAPTGNAQSSAGLGKHLLHKGQAPLCCPPSTVLPLLQKQPIMGFLVT